MNCWKNYFIARSISDALKALSDSKGVSQVIAGGTDLLLDIQQGRVEPVDLLVDVSEIPEMKSIEILEGELFIGAAVTHRILSQHTIIQHHCAALATACRMIGGPQVRNVATIGGNVAHALPAADGTIALMALDASAEIVTPTEVLRIPLGELFLGPGKSILHQGKQILSGFYVNLQKSNQASAFQRIMRPQGVAIAIINIAIWLHCEENLIKGIRIAVGPSGPMPKRLTNVEEMLRNRLLTETTISNAKNAILQETNFRTSPNRATKEYRHEMAGVLFEETLLRAFTRISTH